MKLCFDLGATNLRSALITSGKILQKNTIPTPKTKKEIINSILQLINSYDIKKISSINFGIASFLKNNTTINTCNMDFSGVNLKKIISKKYSLPVYVENDAKCAALGEIGYGYGKKYSNFYFITLGTGIGGAIIINKKLYRGSSFAGEQGQILYNNLKLEKQVSGPASVEIAKTIGINKSSFQLQSLAMQGNKQIIQMYKEMGEKLGIALLNTSYIIDPQAIIVSGGFAKVTYILKSAQKILIERDEINRKIKIFPSKLGENAGLIGASLLDQEKKYIL